MTAHADISELKVDGTQKAKKIRAASVRMANRPWGYVLKSGRADRQRAFVAEIVAMIFGATFLLATGLMWVLPAANEADDVIGFKVAATVVFFILGWVFFSVARRGLREEVQVDFDARELRAMTRNRGGEMTLDGRMLFDEIGSLFIQRDDKKRRASRLFARLLDTDEAMLLAEGRARDLEVIMSQLNKDLGKKTRS